MIAIDRLCASFGAFRLLDISLSLAGGRTLVILGPSGAGKTLLLETVMGIRRPDAGRVLIDGVDVSGRPPEDRGISYIPQDLALFPHLSVRDNILFGPRARKKRTQSDLAARLDGLSVRLGLEALLDRRDVMSLSGGERQRVALARALIVEPRVLFMDEPFSALDRVSRLDAIAILRALKAELDTTVVHVTHDLEEASALADSLAVVVDGRVVQSGLRDEVLSRPRNRVIAKLLLVRNVLPAAALPLAGAPTAQWIGIRPEEIVLLESADSRPNCFPARVDDAVLLASRWVITLALEVPDGPVRLEAYLQPGRFRILRPEPGRRVTAHLPPEAILLLDE